MSYRCCDAHRRARVDAHPQLTGIDWLEVANTSAGAPAWPSDLGGRLSPQWGTHLMDVNFALGDLIALVETQAGAY